VYVDTVYGGGDSSLQYMMSQSFEALTYTTDLVAVEEFCTPYQALVGLDETTSVYVYSHDECTSSKPCAFTPEQKEDTCSIGEPLELWGKRLVWVVPIVGGSIIGLLVLIVGVLYLFDNPPSFSACTDMFSGSSENPTRDTNAELRQREEEMMAPVGPSDADAAFF
ncbi:hypothetical protein KIPB_011113, partial [Kipferlia bialata]